MAVKDAKKTTANDATVPEEYVASSVMHHVDTEQGLMYVERWMICCSRDNTLERQHDALT